MGKGNSPNPTNWTILIFLLLICISTWESIGAIIRKGTISQFCGATVMERLCEFPHQTCVFYRGSSFSPAPDDSIRKNKRAVARGREVAGYRFSGQKERRKQEVVLILNLFLKFGLMFSSGALPDRSTRWRSTTSGCAAASPPPSSPASTSTMTSVSRSTIPRAVLRIWP